MKVASESSALNIHPEDWTLLLLLSVREVFQGMLRTNVVPVFGPSRILNLEWTAMVGLAGELRGVLMFSCDEMSATRIVSKMLDMPLQGPNEETADALGEVCNMIAGSFKHKVSGLSARCKLTPPTVVTGKDYRVHRQESGASQSLFVTFAFMGAPICVSLELAGVPPCPHS